MTRPATPEEHADHDRDLRKHWRTSGEFSQFRVRVTDADREEIANQIRLDATLAAIQKALVDTAEG